MSPLRRLLVVIVAIAVAVTAVGGCQVSTNDEPVAVGPIFDDLLSSTTTTSPTPSTDGATKPVTVYFLRSTDAGERLYGVQRSVAVDARPLQVLNNLFDQRPDGTERVGEAGLTSAIPQSAELLSADVAPGTSTLIVDTEGLFGTDGTVGPASRDAAAQIVFTATGLEGVSEVTFLNSGSEPIGVLIGSGEVAERPVTRMDYENLTQAGESGGS